MSSGTNHNLFPSSQTISLSAPHPPVKVKGSWTVPLGLESVVVAYGCCGYVETSYYSEAIRELFGHFGASIVYYKV